MEGEFVTDGHLGGYIKGGDDATFYPELWTWLVKEKHVSSVLDVGCGEGHSLDFFQGLGIPATGIDGINQGRADIAVHDYTRGPFDWSIKPPFIDLVWCCEVVEHIEERFLPDLLDTLCSGDRLLMTHAEPGQAGYHHVNCQSAAYWQGVLAARGYFFDPDLTSLTRGLAGVNPNPYNHYKRSGLAFRRYD